MTAKQLSILVEEPTGRPPLVAGDTPLPRVTSEGARLRGLAHRVAAAEFDSQAAHMRRAANLVEGPDAWAARPYLVSLFLCAAWHRRQRIRMRDNPHEIDRLDRLARAYLAAVLALRDARRWAALGAALLRASAQ